ncbi:hypothetical protein B0H16DRAFT_445023 [Mycena metata]|uniref:Uncharacterized protein n=1 Tax=Mycena metata TaxID=1033252 RepID=A0AAD7JGQ3_9AGAR|nr:hypothetical protein B0H16DRAFT_445023 [Mycena metata]
MFKLLTILPVLAALVATSVAAPVGTQTTTADAAQSTPCTAGDGAAEDADLPLCKDVANGFGCTNVAFFNSCFGTPPCPGTTFSAADLSGFVCG